MLYSTMTYATEIKVYCHMAYEMKPRVQHGSSLEWHFQGHGSSARGDKRPQLYDS